MPEDYDLIHPKPQINFAAKVVNWLQGRTTGWLISFFITGNLFHVFHRLDSTYITFITVMMGFVLGHSTKEDYFAQKKSDDKQ